jgi:lipopolysaccharide biosynthesis glycosyltransferase
LHEYDNHVLYTKYEKYFKTGYINPKFIDNNLYQRYHTAIFKLDVVNTVPLHISRVIVLDVDMLVLEDLSNMYKIGDEMPDKFMIATQEGYSEDSYFTGGKKYKNAKTHFFKPYGLNTGAVIFNLNHMRKDNLTAYKFIEINDEYPRIPDQDMFNTWAYYNPEKVGLLPCRWNTREYVPCFTRNVTFNISRTDRGIFHGNNMKGMSPFIMDPTPEYAFEQRLHRDYSNVFFKLCGISHEQMGHAIKKAHQAEADITLNH